MYKMFNQKQLLKFVWISQCTNVIPNTAQSSYDYLPPKPTDNNHSSNADYWRKVALGTA